jgi:hypothetical protein
MSAAVANNECPICYDVVDITKNNATTPCGHTFCFSCISQALIHNNECPCCRGTLQEEVWEEFDEEEDEDEDNDEEDDEDSHDEEAEEDEEDEEKENPEHLQHVEVISRRFAALGYTMTDVISMFMSRPSRLDLARGSEEFIDKMVQDFDTIVEDGDKVCGELAAIFVTKRGDEVKEEEVVINDGDATSFEKVAPIVVLYQPEDDIELL